MTKVAKAFDVFVKWLTIVTIAIAGTLVIIRLLGFDQLIVVTGSMKDTLPIGSVAIVNTHDKTPQESKIMAYRLESDEGADMIVMHRVLHVNDDGSYITRGDENKTEIGSLVYPIQTRGTFLFAIPYVGFLLAKLNTGSKLVIASVLIALNVFAYLLNGEKEEEGKEERLDESEVASQ